MFDKHFTSKAKDPSDGRPLTPEDIKKYQQMIEEIGSRKIKGFMYIAAVGEKIDSGDYSSGDGIIFANKWSPEEALYNLIRTLRVPLLKLLSFYD